jgi:hypothetical protein
MLSKVPRMTVLANVSLSLTNRTDRPDRPLPTRSDRLTDRRYPSFWVLYNLRFQYKAAFLG